MQKVSFEDLYRKKVVGTKTCDECGTEYEIYDIYIKGEFKSRSTECGDCIARKEEERMQQEFLKTRARQLMHEYRQVTESPFGLQDVTFDDYQPENESQRKALEITKQFTNGELQQTTLFFQGDTGLGKSHLAYCCYKSFEEKLIPSIFIDLPSLLTKIRNTYGYSDSKQVQEKIMSNIKNCDLLVLDDIGAEYVKPDANGFESWAADILFQIVNARQGKKSIYTTNFTSKHLTQKYGMMSKRIISRLMSNAKIIKVEGDDHRLKGLE